MKLLTPILLGAALIAGCAAPALASPQQYQADDQDRQANTQAYSTGYAQGQADARSHAARNDQPSSQWVRVEDQTAYRQGYDAGYDNLMNHSVAAVPGAAMPHGDQQATQFGYQDGLAAGREDSRKGDKFKPASHDLYKNGAHGWTPELGTKGQYEQLYRESFMKGYEDGFRGTGPH